MANDDSEDILTPADLGHKLVVALRSVTDPQALMQAIADRSLLSLRNEMNTRLDGITEATKLWHDDLVRVPTEVQKSVGSLHLLLEQHIRASIAEMRTEFGREIVQVMGHAVNLDTRITTLGNLHEEKFQNVGVRFNELNTRLTEGDRYKQTAVDAALKAAQTLVDKQQESNKESIRKTEELFIKQFENITKTIEDLKVLVLAREAKTSITDPETTAALRQIVALRLSNEGGAGEKRGGDATNQWAMVVIGAIATVSLAIFAAVELFVHGH